MKIKNVTSKVIFRKVGKDMRSFEPDEIVEVHDNFALSSGLDVVKGDSKASKPKKVVKPKKEKRSLKDKVLDLLDDGKINNSNKKRK